MNVSNEPCCKVSCVANERNTRLIELLLQEVSFQYLNKSSCGSTCFVKVRESDQPTQVPIMLSTCKVELEDVIGHEREKHTNSEGRMQTTTR